METNIIKIKAFEYLTKLYIDWFKEQNPKETNVNANFSKLKLMKLLFFTAAVDANANEDGLLDFFDNFYAMPYGHVESDVYDNLAKLNCFGFNGNEITSFNESNGYFDKLTNIQNLVKAVNSLKGKNPQLILEDAIDLVDLSHEWYSWKSTFNLARSMNRNSLKIPLGIIKNEQKFFDVIN